MGHALDEVSHCSSLQRLVDIRYEYYPTPYSDHGKGVRELDLNNMNVYIGGNGSVPVNDGISAGHGEFLPRVGIAWRPYAKTVIRAGYGLAGDSNNWRFMRNDYPVNISTLWTSTGNGGTKAAACTAGTANACPSSFTPAASLTGANSVAGIPTGLTLATVPNISMGIVPLPAGISTESVPLNLCPLTLVYSNWSASGTNTSKARVLNAQFGTNWPDENEIVPEGRSYYNSMQAKLTRRIGNTSTVGIVETWSKVIDYTDNEEIGGNISWNGPALFSKNKGLASYNRKSNFEAHWVYKLPFGKGEKCATSGIGGAILGGWQISGVVTVLTGTPFSVVDSGYTTNLSASDQIAITPWYEITVSDR